MRRALGCIVVFLTLGLFTASVTPAAEPELVLKGATAWKQNNLLQQRLLGVSASGSEEVRR